MTNSDYRRLNHIDSVTATRELRNLVQASLIEQHGTRGGAYYTLNVTAPHEEVEELTDEEKVLAYVREHGSISNAKCRALLGIDAPKAWYLLKKLHDKELLKRVGGKRWTQYVLP